MVKKKEISSANLHILIVFTLIILGTIGYVKCVIKMFECNWEPAGKAEVFYTLGTFTGLGAIIGWFDIEDK